MTPRTLFRPWRLGITIAVVYLWVKTDQNLMLLASCLAAGILLDMMLWPLDKLFGLDKNDKKKSND